MKKTTSTKRKLVLERETVKSLVSELEARHLQDIRGGARRGGTILCPPGCSEPESGCSVVTISGYNTCTG